MESVENVNNVTYQKPKITLELCLSSLVYDKYVRISNQKSELT